MQNENNLQELTKAVREGNVIPERAREYWKSEEREELKRLFYQGRGITEIALQLQRSEMAVVQQLMTAGLLTSPGASRPRKSTMPKCLCEKCGFNSDGCIQFGCRMREENHA
ncbi:hypothetical protein AALA82_13185 [Oscillospiraceae bacterium 50-16]